MKICWDVPQWSMTRQPASTCWPSWLSRCGLRSRLLPVEDLLPPIGVGGGDLSVASKALACRDAALHWPSWHVVQQLWARLTVFPPASPSTLATHHRTATARRQRLGAQQGHRRQRRCPRWLRLLMNRVQVGGLWRWLASLLHRSHQGGRRLPNVGPWSVLPRYPRMEGGGLRGKGGRRARSRGGRVNEEGVEVRGSGCSGLCALCCDGDGGIIRPRPRGVAWTR
jgi:hypothetical protein